MAGHDSIAERESCVTNALTSHPSLIAAAIAASSCSFRRRRRRSIPSPHHQLKHEDGPTLPQRMTGNAARKAGHQLGRPRTFSRSDCPKMPNPLSSRQVVAPTPPGRTPPFSGAKHTRRSPPDQATYRLNRTKIDESKQHYSDSGQELYISISNIELGSKTAKPLCIQRSHWIQLRTLHWHLSSSVCSPGHALKRLLSAVQMPSLRYFHITCSGFEAATCDSWKRFVGALDDIASQSLVSFKICWEWVYGLEGFPFWVRTAD